VPNRGRPISAQSAARRQAASAELRDVIETLAAVERPSVSEGEARAARWIAERLESLGCDVEIDEETAYGHFWRPLFALTLAGALAGRIVLRGRRRRGAALALLAAAGIADEIALGPYLTRRAVYPRGTTTNVMAATGDRGADRTLVLLAHHDAARAGIAFSQRPQKWLWRRFPGYIASHDTSAQAWFPVIGAPLLVVLGALLGRRGIARTGAVMCASSAFTFADMGMRSSVPAANDNLTAVAVLVALARALRERPIEGLRVLLVSCGAEETLQEGIRAFGRRRFAELPTDRTWFLNLESVGSPELVPLESEGSLVMRDYDREFTDFVCECAAEAGTPLRRGSRSWTSTDGCVPLVAGYRAATLVSLTPWKTIANYHSPSDTPENVDYGTVERTVAVAERVARRLAQRVA
jgi:peptidase M28-like protein